MNQQWYNTSMPTLEQQIEVAPTDTLEAIAWGEESVGKAGRDSSIRVIKYFVNMTKAHMVFTKATDSVNFIITNLRNNGFQF